jgi:putative transposase
VTLRDTYAGLARIDIAGYFEGMTMSGEPHRKRCKRYDEAGHAHYLTFSCLRRQPFLTRDRCRAWFIEAVEAARVRACFDLWAFVIMPEHTHLLVLPHEGVVISRVLQAVKQPVAQKALGWLRREHVNIPKSMEYHEPGGRISCRFWQPGGGYDRNLWSLEEILEKVRYIHDNPIRRGLVDRPQDWFWSSWRAWEEGVNEPLKIDKDSLPWV